MNCLLTTAYWPNLHYFYYVLNSDRVFVEQFDNYQKQSFRNRTRILSANGVLALTIPVAKNGQKEQTQAVKISYKENWQIKHWRSITSAYKNSPYFEHFENAIEVFYTQRYENLLEYNQQQLQTILRILKIKADITLTGNFEKDPPFTMDFRECIHPKVDFRVDSTVSSTLLKPYYQTFEAKFAFTPNLSILDLLFNAGLETSPYLKVDR